MIINTFVNFNSRLSFMSILAQVLVFLCAENARMIINTFVNFNSRLSFMSILAQDTG